VKNLIVVGDSFCSYSEGWPRTLANELNLNLICYGEGGQPWWNARNFITTLSHVIIDNTEIIVFAHTSPNRIPTLNDDIGKVDHSKKAETEIEKSIHLYYKYIHDQSFIDWAHKQWFCEISRVWSNKKLCHLHCFPCTVKYSDLLQGINITTNLTAISLNELGSTEFNLFNDKRSNHFNQHNNIQLGLQIAEQLKNYSNRTIELDISKFEQLITYWTARGTDWR
jgi:hypothetical protein